MIFYACTDLGGRAGRRASDPDEQIEPRDVFTLVRRTLRLTTR